MKFTIKEIISLNQGLNALNGKQVVVKQEDGKESIMIQPYDFGPKILWNIAKNTSIISKQVKIYGEARDSIIKKLTNGEREIDQKNKYLVNKFFDEVEELEKADVEVTVLLKFKLDDLKVDENKIPPSVLVALLPLIDE